MTYTEDEIERDRAALAREPLVYFTFEQAARGWRVMRNEPAAGHAQEFRRFDSREEAEACADEQNLAVF